MLKYEPENVSDAPSSGEELDSETDAKVTPLLGAEAVVRLMTNSVSHQDTAAQASRLKRGMLLVYPEEKSFE